MKLRSRTVTITELGPWDYEARVEDRWIFGFTHVRVYDSVFLEGWRLRSRWWPRKVLPPWGMHNIIGKAYREFLENRVRDTKDERTSPHA